MLERNNPMQSRSSEIRRLSVLISLMKQTGGEKLRQNTNYSVNADTVFADRGLRVAQVYLEWGRALKSQK